MVSWMFPPMQGTVPLPLSWLQRSSLVKPSPFHEQKWHTNWRLHITYHLFRLERHLFRQEWKWWEMCRKWTEKLKEEEVFYNERKCLLAHTHMHAHKEKPHWRVHLAWLCYRFILVWANVTVSKGGRRNAVLIDKPNVIRLRTLSGQSDVPGVCFFLLLPLALLSPAATVSSERPIPVTNHSTPSSISSRLQNFAATKPPLHQIWTLYL